MTRQCCVCKRVHVDGRWVSAPWALCGDAEVTHGYCDRCFDDFMRTVPRAVLEARAARLKAAQAGQ